MSSWLGEEPDFSFFLSFSFATPGTACIIARPHSMPEFSELPTWIFCSNLNRLADPITMGTHVAIHVEAADFCHPDERTPLAQGRTDTVIYLNNDWLAFRFIDSALGRAYWLAMPHKMASLSRPHRLKGWWAGQRTPGTPFSLPTPASMIQDDQIIFPEQALSVLSLLSSQVSVTGDKGQDSSLP